VGIGERRSHNKAVTQGLFFAPSLLVLSYGGMFWFRKSIVDAGLPKIEY
jgi:hypothetical protein